MPTNYKFAISAPKELEAKLLFLTFKKLSPKAILDIYLESKPNETIKLRIENNKNAKLVHFERNNTGELTMHPNVLFDNKSEGLEYIVKNHKETKRLEKTLDTYTHKVTQACIHTFNTEPKLYFLSIEDDNESKIIEVLKDLGLNSQNRIEKSFDEIIDNS